MTIKIIGTNHFQNKEEVLKELNDFKPDIIGVELCQERVQASIDASQGKKPKLPIILTILGIIIQLKAKKQNITYGSDLLAGFEYAKANTIKVELIDRPINQTMNDIKKLPFFYKTKIVFGIFKDLLVINFGKKKQRWDNKDVLEKDTQDETQKIAKKYPELKRILIDKRNTYMASKIAEILIDNPDKRLAVITGIGHRDFLKEVFND